MKSQVDDDQTIRSRSSANKALEEERQAYDIADRLRGLLDARDNRLTELEEPRESQGPRISAEHDYLVEQIEERKKI